MSEPMKVFCRDGEAGWLKEIIIDQDGGRPIKLRMQHLNRHQLGRAHCHCISD